MNYRGTLPPLPAVRAAYVEKYSVGGMHDSEMANLKRRPLTEPGASGGFVWVKAIVWAVIVALTRFDIEGV